jgi:hypothetical protein
MNSTTESESASAPDVRQSKAKRATPKKAKPATKKIARAKKQASRSNADRANKKGEVIAMMKRAKGATLAEIMAATDWQPDTVRGFVRILGSKGGRRSSRPRTPRVGGPTRLRSKLPDNRPFKRRFRFTIRVAPCLNVATGSACITAGGYATPSSDSCAAR